MRASVSIDTNEREALLQKFLNAEPFPYVVIDNFLEPEMAMALSKKFPAIESMDVNYKGLNERKGEHSNFDSLSEEFTCLKDMLNSSDFIKQVESITGFTGLFTIDDRYGRGLHQGGNNSFLDTHIDYNLHPLRKKQRRLNLIIFLHEAWEEAWGGCLQFSDKSLTPVASVVPRFNRAVIFVCNSISYHGYNRIECPDNVSRKSFYTYYFTEPEKNLIYHDTVFRASSKDTGLRRAMIVTKEFAKNTAKRMIYYLGLNRLLK